MSDFVSIGWSYWISIIALGGVVFCLWLLFTQRSWLGGAPKGEESTGHVWDGVGELNTPIPRWWVIMYIGLCVVALFIMFLYPALGSNPGVVGYTAAKQVEEERAEYLKTIAPVYEKFAAMPIDELVKNPEAHMIGERLFLNNCAQCHGSDAKGQPNYPNLTDGDWLYGGEPATILQTITEGRHGIMAPLGAAIPQAKAEEVANYVRSLSGLSHDATLVPAGKVTFNQFCVACHGADAKGNKALGAPNLTDNIWLNSSSKDAIVNTILNGREGLMPAQKNLLTPDQIRMLTSYVWSLSNKEAVAQ
ncbi:MAG: cytochrome-c oxidase, cbb3-type subunit III [Alcaligenaceae bacterium]|jgi:cytochrome c oxidase cbb3-type subunit 3|uniref:cytochrome-c oxidase, cbb3-type subunit III n=1 Tax=Advenella alkanexedens TaxID=1481665 RepID=UPI00168F2BF3|nr:cytochrome-c oxidase, cbb3-type subunit III [Advenella alkanexedens]NLN68348.1 cytochrome-c oxidase, cbb3-type subunit III [Alcaligenaceae bacterium]WKU18702.1 cytochrome-c oxidase, cbb3-type subunit III [Advenella alkanexedens]